MDSNFEENFFSFSNNNLEDSFINDKDLFQINENLGSDLSEKSNENSDEKQNNDLRQLKKQKNRISAKKSRNKKNKEIITLVNENKRLREENLELKNQLNQIKDKLSFLCQNDLKCFEIFFSSNKKVTFNIFKES